VPTSRIRCSATAAASAAKSARPSSGAKCRSSIRTIVGRSDARLRRYRPGRRRRAARRIGAEEEVQVLARLPQPPHELVHEPRLPDPRLALDEQHVPVAGFRLLEERLELLEFGAAAVECCLARDADAPQRPLRLDAERLRALLPPLRGFARIEDVGQFGGRLEARVALLLDQRVDDLFQERRELRVDLGDPAWLLVQQALQDDAEVFVVVRMLAAREFV
jgi:hypothetical protein